MRILKLCFCLCSIRNKKQVAEVIVAFKGKVRQMLRHSEASSVVEYAYNDKAILSQRLMLTEELYGNTFQVCKVAIFSGFSFFFFLWICFMFQSLIALGLELIDTLVDSNSKILFSVLSMSYDRKGPGKQSR